MSAPGGSVRGGAAWGHAASGRFVLGLVGVNCLVGGLSLAGLAGLAVWPGVAAAGAGLLDGVAPAAAAALAGAALGLAAGACLRRAGGWTGLVLACCVLVLFVPAPRLTGVPRSVLDLEAAGGFGGAVSRAAALMLLASFWAWRRVDPGLRRAALSAGASPLQAWRHTVLAVLWRPALLGAAAGFAAALAQTPAAQVAAGGVFAGEAWHLPAGLLAAAFGAAALRAAVRGG